MKICTIVLFVVSLLFLSCNKSDVKPGINTTVSGQFYDAMNKEPYQNLKLRVAEYKSRFNFTYGQLYTLVGYRDSAITDTNGKYKISFTTSGQGNTYFLEFNHDPVNVSISDKGSGGASFGYASKLISNIGSANEFDFDVIRRYYMQIRVIVHDNPSPPLIITIWNPHLLIGGTYIYGKNNDTTVNVPILKNTGGFNLEFYIIDPATQKTYGNPDIPLNPIVDKAIIQGGTYNVFPATFK